jgi:hypothetical protein
MARKVVVFAQPGADLAPGGVAEMVYLNTLLKLPEACLETGARSEDLAARHTGRAARSAAIRRTGDPNPSSRLDRVGGCGRPHRQTKGVTVRSTLRVRKRCGSGKGATCALQSAECPHTWTYEPMIGGVRMPVVEIDRYASARSGPQHVRTEARAQEWAARIQGDWLNGRDPRQTPTEQANATRGRTVTDLVEAYRRANAAHPTLDADPDTGHAPAPRLKQPQVVWSELRHIADYFGGWPSRSSSRRVVCDSFEMSWPTAGRQSTAERPTATNRACVICWFACVPSFDGASGNGRRG